MRTIIAAVCLCLGICLTACQTAADLQPWPTLSPAPPILRIGVTDSAAALAELVGGPYQASGSAAVLQFVVGNSDTLADDLAQGHLDALLVHHVPEEKSYWFNPVAVDGLVFLTHPDNPVRSLSLAEIQALYSGRIDNWQALDGPDIAVVLVTRERGAGTRTEIQQSVLGELPLNINARVAAANEAVAGLVTEEAGAIGYTMLGSGYPRALLAVDGVPPTPATTAEQTYPLTIPLYFVNSEAGEPEGALRHFLAWLQSEAGQEIIGSQYGRVR